MVSLYWGRLQNIARMEDQTMAVSKAQQKAVQKYVKDKYDRVVLTMPKGKKEIIQAHAESKRESVNAFINHAIDDALKQDTAGAE